MNTRRVSVLCILVLFALSSTILYGCQPTTTDEEIRSMVEAEVNLQLSSQETKDRITEAVSSIDTLSVQRLEVVDTTGNEVVVVDSEGGQTPALTVFDSNGDPGISLLTDGADREVVIWNADGRTMAFCGTYDGAGTLGINNSDGDNVWSVATDERENPIVYVHNSDGESAAKFIVDERGNSHLALDNSEGESRLIFSFDAKGNPVFQFHGGPTGSLYVIAGDEDEEVGTSLVLTNSRGGIVSIMSVEDDDGTLVLLDKNGQEVFSSP